MAVPEKLLIDGNELRLDEWSLSKRSHGELTQLARLIEDQICVSQSEHDRLQATMLQEQEQTRRLQEEFRTVEKELLNVSSRMPHDKWSLLSGAYTSDKLRHELLGPYWQRIKEIKQKSDLLEVWCSGRGRLHVLGRNPPYLFFAEPQADYRDEDGHGPPTDWWQYRATTKTQRVFELHCKRHAHLNAALARITDAISKREREESLEAKRRERERAARERQQRKRDRHDEIRAAAAANDEETRKQAERLKPRLIDQQHCPYCGGQLAGELHVDHIYPVSKGGRSVVRNLVKACVECNQKKGNLTLTQFIKEYSLNRDAVERRLTELEKDF